MAKKRMGRPNQGRVEILQVKLTATEKSAFQREAKKMGLSLSDWVRQTLRERAFMPGMRKMMEGDEK